MKTHVFWIIIAVLACSIPAVSAATDQTVGGDQGWYTIHCNVYGSDVYMDDKYVGTIQQGTLTIPALTTATPYQQFTVKKYGYSTFIGTVPGSPGKGQTLDLYATLNAIPTGTQTGVGGDMGWYIVHCNVDGALVYFDGVDKGTITQGILYVPIYTTGTPYHAFTVKKDGYTQFDGTISIVPAKGESVDLYATLNPTGAIPTIGGDIGWYVVHGNVDGAAVYFDNVSEGKIYQGLLRVQVYVTGTPFTNYTVSKNGYFPYTGNITKYPGKGEIVDLNSTLTAIPQTTATKSPVPVEITGIALVLAGIGAVLYGKIRK